MKPYILLSLISGMLFTISGCSPLPEAVTSDKKSQVKIQSAQHWDTIAEHLSDRITERLDLNSITIYLNETRQKSKFKQVFSKQLTSKLVNKNVKVSISPLVDSIELKIDVDTIRHPDDRDGSRSSYTAGFANLWLIHKEGAYGLIPTVIALDLINSRASKTNTEVVITARLVNNSTVYFSETNVYYITDSSFDQFSNIGSTQLTDKEVPGVL